MIGVGLHAPVRAGEVFVDRGLDVHARALVGAGGFALLAIDDVGAGRGEVPGVEQRRLGLVLDLLDADRLAGIDAGEHARGDIGGEASGDFRAKSAGGLARAGQREGDLALVKSEQTTIPFHHDGGR